MIHTFIAEQCPDLPATGSVFRPSGVKMMPYSVSIP